MTISGVGRECLKLFLAKLYVSYVYINQGQFFGSARWEVLFLVAQSNFGEMFVSVAKSVNYGKELLLRYKE